MPVALERKIKGQHQDQGNKGQSKGGVRIRGGFWVRLESEQGG